MPLVNGSNLLIYDGDVALGHTTSATLGLTMDTPASTNKDSGGWFEAIAGKRTANIKAEGLIDYSDALNFAQMCDYLITKKKFQVVFKSASMFYFGEGLVTQVEEVSETEKAVSYSCSIAINGRLYFEPRLPWNLVFQNWENIYTEWQNV